MYVLRFPLAFKAAQSGNSWKSREGKKRMHEHVQSVHMEVLPSQRKACPGNKDTETQYSKSSTYELSSWELSKMWTCVSTLECQLLCCTTLLLKVRTWSYRSCPTLCSPMDYSLWGSSVYGVLQARILQWAAMTSSRRSLYCTVHFSSVQSLSRIRLFVTPWIAARQASLSITNSWILSKLMSIESVMSSNHLILCCPLLHLPSIFPRIRVFSNESILGIRWPKYWNFSFSKSVLLMNIQDWFSWGWTGWISLQSKGFSRVFSNTTIQKHQSFDTQLSFPHPYITTRKTIALTGWTSVGKVMSLLFNMLSRLVITFLPRSKRLNFMAEVTICQWFWSPEK